MSNIPKNSEIVYYLAQGYSHNPAQASHDAMMYTAALRMQKKTVFSPILHTHFYHSLLKSQAVIDDGKILKINYDLTRIDVLLKEEDYVEWDLAILNLSKEEPRCKSVICDNPTQQCEGCKDRAFNSKLVMLFAPSCFNNQYDENGALKDDEQWEWASKGDHREYQWAKAHHVKCLLLEPFLEGKEVLI